MEVDFFSTRGTKLTRAIGIPVASRAFRLYQCRSSRVVCKAFEKENGLFGEKQLARRANCRLKEIVLTSSRNDEGGIAVVAPEVGELRVACDWLPPASVINVCH